MNTIISMQTSIEIKQIRPDQALQVKRLVIDCVVELKMWKPHLTSEQIEQELDAVNEFNDLDNVEATYFNNNGTFLVLLDNEKVVGSGTIKKIDDDICEVKRVFFAKEYRGKGLGSKMMHHLLDFAKTHGYKKARLDVLNPTVQTAAVALYKKFGFYEIVPYCNSSISMGLFMEKILD
jgi:putative acetyltransferase